MSDTVKCQTCKLKVSKDEANKQYTYKTTTYFQCRNCLAKRVRKYQITPKGKEAVKKIYENNRDKMLARAKVKYRVRTGEFIKPKVCEECKVDKPLQGHHENYDKPLEVIWLCSRCHANADKVLESKPLKP